MSKILLAKTMEEREIEMKNEKVIKADLSRRRVAKACVYCHRSHLMCDADRPCFRCRKRNIAHLCRDEEDDLHVLFKKLRNELNQYKKPPSTSIYTCLNYASTLTRPTPVTPECNTAFGPYSISPNPTDMQPGAIGQGSKKDHLTLIDNWVYGEFGIIAADRAVTQGPPSVLEPYEGFQHSRLVSFVEKILSQAVDMDSDQTTMVLSDRTLLTFCQGSPSFHKYLQTHLDTKSFEEIKSLQSTVRSDFLKSLLTLEYKDLLRITQSFDHLVTSTYKYMTILTLPGMIVRRSGLISMVSDQMVLLLGYTREEMTPNRYLHEFMPCKNLYDFYTGPGTQ
eukprot:Ihof_evm10s30 gene=Ihof_evmTU10s30